jgi:hypothetical protein
MASPSSGAPWLLGVVRVVVVALLIALVALGRRRRAHRIEE